jgi:hypothetical protein
MLDDASIERQAVGGSGDHTADQSEVAGAITNDTLHHVWDDQNSGNEIFWH